MAKKNRIKEAPIDYTPGPERMSPDIEQKLRSQDHPLGAHPAFPDVDGDGIPDNFEELLASKRFRDVVEKVKAATGLERVDPMSIMSMQPMFQRALMKVMQIESQHKSALEKLAVDLVKTEMGIPEGDLQQQRFEKAIADELGKTAEIIKKTGVFNSIDKLYGDIEKTEVEGGETAGEGGDEFATGAEGLPGAEETSPAEETLDTEPAAEGYKIEKDLPLILENKGIDLPNLEEMTKRSNLDIDKISKEIDDLVDK